jgi:hypothetical protein
VYTYNEEYKILKAYDPRSFILGLKEVCGINIDMDKSHIGAMFSYRLLVDNEYVDIYDRTTFLDWIATKVEMERDNFYSYVTSLDYQIKLKQNSKQETVESETPVVEKTKTIRAKKATK